MERGKDGTFLLGLVGLLTTKRYRNSPPCGAPPRRELDDEEKEKVTARARGYEDPREFFSVDARADHDRAAAFYPKPVIVRFSDFKTNEYANLLGGKHYEPKEGHSLLSLVVLSLPLSPLPPSSPSLPFPAYPSLLLDNPMLGWRGASRYYDLNLPRGVRARVRGNEERTRGIQPDQPATHDPPAAHGGRSETRVLEEMEKNSM